MLTALNDSWRRPDGGGRGNFTRKTRGGKATGLARSIIRFNHGTELRAISSAPKALSRFDLTCKDARRMERTQQKEGTDG
jgi:hypothetical protein